MKEKEREDCLWVVSDDAELYARMEKALKGIQCDVRIITKDEVGVPGFWRKIERLPGAVLLDLDEDLDGGVSVVRDIKRAHSRLPLIVISKELNQEFGTKIVTEGVSYYLLRDFDPAELSDVVDGLVRPQRNPIH